MYWREPSGNSTKKAVFRWKKCLRRNSRLSAASPLGNVSRRMKPCARQFVYAERAAEKLRGERQFCRHIAVFVKTSPFAVNEPYYGNLASEKLLIPTQDTQDIIAAAVRALDRIWVDGHRYAKAGCMLNDFAPDGVSLLNLFDDTLLRSNSNQLMKVVDGINHSGLGKVWFAGRGIASEWQMKREMLSPAYTTRWSELPVAKL